MYLCLPYGDTSRFVAAVAVLAVLLQTLSVLPRCLKPFVKFGARFRVDQVECSVRNETCTSGSILPDLVRGLLKPRCLVHRERPREELIAEGRIVDRQTLVELL